MLDSMLLQVIVSGVVGGATFLLIFALFRFPVPHEPPMHRRIAAAAGYDPETLFENRIFGPVMNLALAGARRIAAHRLRRRIREGLYACGNPTGYAVEEYLAICMLCGGVLALASGLILIMLGSVLGLLVVPMLAAAGFIAPLWSLQDTGRKRVGRIAKQLPYTLDLISLTMSSGSSFNEAARTLIHDRPEDDLNQELAITLSEMEYGTPRGVAMDNMADRIPLETLRSVVGATNQAERLGAPLADILKLQADALRNQRSVLAEKLAASASLRILIPSMMILIAVVIVVFAPLIMRLIRGELY
jgi:tight adherence protein C